MPRSEMQPAQILVVDDDPSVRRLLAHWLSSAGHRCLEATEAESAWRVLQSTCCDLVTLDNHMPGESGLELLSRIQVSFPQTEVIIVSAQDSAATAIESLNRGAQGYLIKPIRKEPLLFEVKRALEHRHLVLNHLRYQSELENRVRQQTLEVRRAQEETIHRLVAAAAFRDMETGAHIKRTGLYSEIFAEALGWSEDDIENIRMAAPMHDVGKLSIPDSILCKPGALTPKEFEIMKGHTIIGAQLLGESNIPLLRLGRQIALCHHERWDGSGYPRGLVGTEIPEAARMVAIVDAYDAMSHDRVYRHAFKEAEVVARMERDSGSHFDPFLFKVFLALLPEMRRVSEENPDSSLVIIGDWEEPVAEAECTEPAGHAL